MCRGRKPDTKDRRDLRRHDQCHWSAEPGYRCICKERYPILKKYDTKIVVNVCGKTTEDYIDVVERLGDEPVDMLEINISCPNVKRAVSPSVRILRQ